MPTPRVRLSTLVYLLALTSLTTACASDRSDSLGVDEALGGSVRSTPISPLHPATPDSAGWPAPHDVADRVRAAGLSLGPMGTAQHYHPTLTIYIDGTSVPVAANIGVDPATGAMSALHTHGGDGTLHVEAHTVDDQFTLGQLFTQWGVPLSQTQIGSLTVAQGELQATANGKVVPGDPNNLVLADGQEIVIRVR